MRKHCVVLERSLFFSPIDNSFTSSAPTWNGDLNLSKWGPNGDLILSEMGTKWGPWAAEMGTKWGPTKHIFDKLTEMCKFIEINSFFGEKYSRRVSSFSAQCLCHF